MWYVYDNQGNIEASGLSESEALELVADLKICEPDMDWNCAEDAENGDVEEA